MHQSLFARTFTVYAAEQVDSADRWLTIEQVPEGERSEQADAYFTGIDAAVVVGGIGRVTSRRWTASTWSLGQSDNPAAFYTTSANEHPHWTGHSDRP